MIAPVVTQRGVPVPVVQSVERRLNRYSAEQFSLPKNGPTSSTSKIIRSATPPADIVLSNESNFVLVLLVYITGTLYQHTNLSQPIHYYSHPLSLQKHPVKKTADPSPSPHSLTYVVPSNDEIIPHFYHDTSNTGTTSTTIIVAILDIIVIGIYYYDYDYPKGSCHSDEAS